MKNGVVTYTLRDRRRLAYLLDLLCGHEEAVINSHTVKGFLDRRDGDAARVVLRSQRVWGSAQKLILKLTSHANGGCP